MNNNQVIYKKLFYVNNVLNRNTSMLLVQKRETHFFIFDAIKTKRNTSILKKQMNNNSSYLPKMSLVNNVLNRNTS